jgi:hypothetical protein
MRVPKCVFLFSASSPEIEKVVLVFNGREGDLPFCTREERARKNGDTLPLKTKTARFLKGDDSGINTRNPQRCDHGLE